MSAGEMLRVLAFNFERGIHLEEQLEFLSCHPAIDGLDVLLANELDVGCSRSGNRDTAALIADRLGMDYVFGLEFTELVGEANEKGHHGNAVFSRWPILEVRMISLSLEYDWFFDAQKRTGGRQAILVRLEVQGREMGVVCTHLENRTTPEGRLRQLRAVLDAAEQMFPGMPVILGGDLNTCGFHGGDKEGMKRCTAQRTFVTQHLSAPETLEPCLFLALQRGFFPAPPLQGEGASVVTRRKPVSGGMLTLRVDWLLLRDVDADVVSVLSTRKADFPHTGSGSALERFAGPELSDHNMVYLKCHPRWPV